MSYVLTATGYHDKAIAQRWIQMFEMKLYGAPEHIKTKVWRVVTSCKNEDQLSRYYFVVQNYSDCMAWFQTYDLKSWVAWHVYRLMRFI